MTLDQLLEKMRDGQVDPLKDIPDQRAKTIIVKLLRQIARTVANARDEKVQVPGLGLFHVRKVEKEKEGKKIVRRQVRFIPAGDMKRMAKRTAQRAT